MRTIFYNGTIYTGTEILKNHAVITEDGVIFAVVPEGEAGIADARVNLQGRNLSAAFIDLQIYGGNDHLFSEHPSVEALKATYQYCLGGGAPYFQPTMATQSDELMDKAIDAVANYQAQGLPGVLGLHLEGPYINPLKRGAHFEAYIQTPNAIGVQTLLQKAGRHLSMMTLAPERCDPAIIRQLMEAGVIISAGHTNATYAEALAGFALGIQAATHLFNAMTPLSHRAPGMVGALLGTGAAAVSIVADGHHVDFPVIGIAKRLLGEKLFLITDAVTANNAGIYQHQLSGDKYVLPNGILSGSALTMIKAVQNCVEKVGIPLDEALRMASLYPARMMGLEKRLGSIASGRESTLVAFDNRYVVSEVFVQR